VLSREGFAPVVKDNFIRSSCSLQGCELGAGPFCQLGITPMLPSTKESALEHDCIPHSVILPQENGATTFNQK